MKKKVLIIYNKIWPYRIKVFELLNEIYDLTVTYIDEKYFDKKKPVSFKTKLTPINKIGSLVLHKDNLSKIAEQYDAVIGLSDIHWLSLMRLGFISKRKFKLIYWGIGVSKS